MLRVGLFIFLMFLPLQLNAHSPLEYSEPKNGAILKSFPENILLSFKAPAKLIRVSLNEKESIKDESLFKGLFSSKNKMGNILNINISQDFNEKFVVKLPPLSTGHFIINWRAMSEDGHIIKGDFSFSIEEN